MSQVTPQQWLAMGASINYGNHSIFYRDDSDTKDVLVLLHGFPTASWDWHRVWPELKTRFRLIAPDFLGFGFSAKPQKHTYAIKEQAIIVETLLQELGISEFFLLAHDYGDTVAQELLARAEERKTEGTPGLQIKSICFLNGGLFPEVHQARLVQKLLLTPLGPLLGRLYNQRAFNRSFRPIFGPQTQPTEEELTHYWSLITYNNGQRIIHKILHYMPERKIYRERWVRAMQQTAVPLRVINGPVDPVSGIHMVERYRELIPDADVVLLEDIGHYPQMEAPEGVVREYLAFTDRE